MAERTIGGRYELQQPLGGGAMSSVWLAHDAELERDVAVKLLAPDADHARFEREAHAVAGLSHPNICQLYDYGESDGAPYMVLEHLPGGTLEDVLAAKRSLPDEQTARIAHGLAAGLAHAHAHGLVHRDLKPANVLFDGEGRSKIADFGIARIAGGDALTEAGTVLGTAAYLSPEQAAGEPATPESDVYSFGVILFRMLTGRLPFVSANAMELVRMHREQQPPRVEAFRADAPALLAALAFAALAKDPAQRPADGSALVDALSGTVDPTLLLAPAAAAAAAGNGAVTQVIRRPRARPQRRFALLPAVIAAAALLVIAGAAAAYFVTSSGGADSGATMPSIDLPAIRRQNTSPRSTTPIATPTAAPVTATSAPATSEQATTQQSSPDHTSTQETSTAPATTAPATAAATTAAPASLPATTSATIAPATAAPVTTAPPSTTAAPAASTTTPATTAITFTAAP